MQDNDSKVLAKQEETETVIGAEIKTYPTTPDADGWFYLNEQGEAMDIMQKKVGSDLFIKVRMTTGKHAILKELSGDEFEQAQTIAEGMKNNKVAAIERAVIALAMTIVDAEGKEEKMVAEDIGKMKSSDYARIKTASAILNF